MGAESPVRGRKEPILYAFSPAAATWVSRSSPQAKPNITKTVLLASLHMLFNLLSLIEDLSLIFSGSPEIGFYSSLTTLLFRSLPAHHRRLPILGAQL
jgi:hypothetical protein